MKWNECAKYDQHVECSLIDSCQVTVVIVMKLYCKAMQFTTIHCTMVTNQQCIVRHQKWLICKQVFFCIMWLYLSFVDNKIVISNTFLLSEIVREETARLEAHISNMWESCEVRVMKWNIYFLYCIACLITFILCRQTTALFLFNKII